MSKKVVLGIGQSLRGDDGAGLAVVKHWQAQFLARAERPDIEVTLLELPGLALLDYLAGAQQVLLVDAVRSGAQPGSLHLLSEANLAAFCQGSGSAHGWGVAETMLLGRQLQPDRMPEKIDILGIEAGEIRIGEQLSEAVLETFEMAVELIQAWFQQGGWS